MKLLATAAGIAALAIGCRAASSAPGASTLGPPGELGSLGPEHAQRIYGDGIAWRTASNMGQSPQPQNSQHLSPEYLPLSPPPTTSSGHTSFAVNLSGFDGSITHYHISYSDPQVSGEVGVGHVEPTPTLAAIATQGVVCDQSFPGLLSGLLGLDLGVRLNLGFTGVGACIAL
ncbi:hypothetical protein IWQ57_001207 [Coemansia nantahalensis]|uniref:Uncharacterized protein n=1 Tax=Coemansia nantahalensis TaxID=2789366 RepID=A0ACC1K567_9FUNG|nr:hypothetical protein IWQ57_001207 [Coemansia nantahalensis]